MEFSTTTMALMAISLFIAAVSSTAIAQAGPAAAGASRSVRAPSAAERLLVAKSLQAAHVRLLDDPSYLAAFAKRDSNGVSERLRKTAGVDWPVMVAISAPGGGGGPAGWSFGFACKSQSSFPWIECWGGVSA